MAIEIRTARAVLCIVLIVSPNRRNLHEALFARRPDLAATVDPSSPKSPWPIAEKF
jgi:hypothetical protein